MRKVIVLALLVQSACAPALIRSEDGVTIAGVYYSIREVEGDFLSVHSGEIISGTHKEVRVNGLWYPCEGDCAAKVRSVLASQAALEVLDSETAPDGGDGGGGGGGY